MSSPPKHSRFIKDELEFKRQSGRLEYDKTQDDHEDGSRSDAQPVRSPPSLSQVGEQSPGAQEVATLEVKDEFDYDDPFKGKKFEVIKDEYHDMVRESFSQANARQIREFLDRFE